MRIAFLGLGTMGEPMARRLIDAGHALSVFDVSAAARGRFEGLGCTVAGSAAQAAERAEILIAILPDSDAVESALFGDRGAVAALPPGALVLDMSTGDAAHVHRCAARLAVRGVRTMDVPVARSVREARTGQLLVMAGGDAADFEAALPVLEVLGDPEAIHHVGPLGSAIRLKLINNYLSMVNMVVAAEGLTFARRAGIERDVALRVLQSTPAGKGQLNTNYPRKVLRGDIAPDFPLRMGLKDINLALRLGDQVGAPLYLGAAARQAFALASSWGRQDQDCTAMLLLMQDLCGEHDTASAQSAAAPV